jgi:hypothetical protein
MGVLPSWKRRKGLYAALVVVLIVFIVMVTGASFSVGCVELASIGLFHKSQKPKAAMSGVPTVR